MVCPYMQNASGKTSKQALLAKANGKNQLNDLEMGKNLMNQYYIKDLGLNYLGLHPSEIMKMIKDCEVGWLNL